MVKTRKLALAAVMAFAAGYGVNTVWADDDMAAMKATIAQMQQEMAKRDNTVCALQAELERMRAMERDAAGGEPAQLLTANQKATLRIGGEVRVRYTMGWADGYGRPLRNSNDATSNYRSQYAGWSVSRAQMNFDIDLSCDTTARLALRFSEDSNGGFGNTRILQEAWWKWKNIGGVGLGLTVGYQNVPFGMGYNTDAGGRAWGGSSSGMILNPFVMRLATDMWNSNAGQSTFAGQNAFVERDLTMPGVIADYRLCGNEVVLKAGILASPIVLAGSGTNNPGVNSANEIRNIGLVNHVVNIAYNPCWVEGLHLEASYFGEFDNGMGYDGRITNPYGPADYANYQSGHGDSTYRASFDAAAYYKTGAWKFALEGVMTFSPAYRDGFGCAFTGEIDYNVTDRWMLSAEGDYMHYGCTSDNPMWRINSSPIDYEDAFRLSVGTKYEFTNGIFVQAQYLHDFMFATGVKDGEIKDNDAIIFQTGYRF